MPSTTLFDTETVIELKWKKNWNHNITTFREISHSRPDVVADDPAAGMSDMIDETDELSSTGISSYIMLSFTQLAVVVVGKSSDGKPQPGKPDVDRLLLNNSRTVDWELLFVGAKDGGMA